ncbi:hypothetical protein LG201_08015 [Methylobacillus gramineus]|uniref:hypothetical protein n=1 Tax=Methylobacillus gramineus TaxID=755169 RepID=UPI001CFF6990|nr:hypothetical protein [Methylobacillus gramineus]MCB5185148.1 hypothetical protein [Methylobacillus gramineus]
MENDITLTIRLNRELKEDAELACKKMEFTLSAYIRKCLKDAVRTYHVTSVRENGYAKAFMETDEAKRAYDVIVNAVKQSEAIQPQPVPAQPKPPEPMPSRKEVGDVLFDENGHVDPSTMSRKMRREYQREWKRGTFDERPGERQKPVLERFNPEQRLKELIEKEKRTHLTRRERDQKSALITGGVKLSDD